MTTTGPNNTIEQETTEETTEEKPLVNALKKAWTLLWKILCYPFNKVIERTKTLFDTNSSSSLKIVSAIGLSVLALSLAFGILSPIYLYPEIGNALGTFISSIFSSFGSSISIAIAKGLGIGLFAFTATTAVDELVTNQILGRVIKHPKLNFTDKEIETILNNEDCVFTQSNKAELLKFVDFLQAEADRLESKDKDIEKLNSLADKLRQGNVEPLIRYLLQQEVGLKNKLGIDNNLDPNTLEQADLSTLLSTIITKIGISDVSAEQLLNIAYKHFFNPDETTVNEKAEKLKIATETIKKGEETAAIKPTVTPLMDAEKAKLKEERLNVVTDLQNTYKAVTSTVTSTLKV